ncbi:unnamed protein product [Lathyrus oleraceus]|uniref:PHD-type zinc finger plants domain-containing protein n=1 Tax=Pisum sativum TaxID=3888 RepID=A0A9D5AYM9_PEA|nr:uncharacterized protein LOC127076776 isoform X1 [Pisum sativum]KAI5423429.1 hypothetical protein KIW84_046400 [Pisum sativum]
MVDHQIVCCLCGDVGFTNKLFRCNNCHHRFQHSYCSNFYGEVSEIEECDWCQSKGKNSIGSKKPAVRVAMNGGGSSECSGEKILKQHRDEKKKSSLASPRQATRRYKLLKDVMC